MTDQTQLNKTIMRRVYYAFALKIAGHPLTLHAVFLAAAGYMLARLVHVAAVYRNMLEVQVGELGSFIVSTVTHADAATLFVFACAVALGCSFLWHLRMPLVRMPRVSYGG